MRLFPEKMSDRIKSLLRISENRGASVFYLKTEGPPASPWWLKHALESALDRAGVIGISNPQSKLESFLAGKLSRFKLMRNIRKGFSGTRVFCIYTSHSNESEARTFPISYWTDIIPYCFDCWPKDYPGWAAMFRRQRISVAFFHGHQTADYFSKALPSMTSLWLPEAVNPEDFISSKTLAEREIDVLELGRQFKNYHEKIAGPLAVANRRHVFNKSDGKNIFFDFQSLADALGNSKISICFPRSMTHPEDAGDVEIVTQRYFESMASKCLVVGHAPEELVGIFGYNPVVEIDDQSSYEQIDGILKNIESYEGLVERNYSKLFEVGTWSVRVEKIINTLKGVPAAKEA